MTFPAWIEWGVRRGATLPQPKGVGPNGKPFCRWCGLEVTGRRQCWCSVECVKRYLRVAYWGALRQYIHDRDCGICARCEFPVGKRWEVDHIRRVVDGGTDDPANLRLLCVPCHVAVGYEQRASTASVA